MLKVAITGVTSSLGRHLLPLLSEQYTVFTMGRTKCDVFCDLSETYNTITLPDNTDIVIHLAAESKASSDEEILRTEEINAVGTLKTCMASHHAKVKHIVVVSSIYATLDSNSSFYSFYSISKKHSEDLASYYCKQNSLPLTIVRPSQIYDDKGYFSNSQPLFYRMVDCAQSGNDIVIYGSNNALKNYIYVEDVANVIMHTIAARCEGVYSCTNSTNVTLTDIAMAAQNAFGNGGSIVFQKEKQSIVDNVFQYDDTLFKKINYYPTIDIVAGMQKISKYRKACI